VREDPRIPELGLTTARGCYARCTFCFVNFKKLRFKSPARVREEVRDIKGKHDVRYLFINDLTFTANLRRAWQICDALGEAGITWSCSTRVEKAPRELLDHMRDCGCRDIWYGVESVDQRVLDLANKRQTVGQIRDAIRETTAAGIKVMTNFIVGLPGETEESLEAMIRFVEEEVVTPASVKYLSPFPGTPIFDDALRRGIIRDPMEYLEHLSRRRVNDENDEIFNVTDLPEHVLRGAFRRLDALRASRVAEHFGGAGQEPAGAARKAG
jgi:anaerobic magnesium-protoporphyrin IX monomethyl ester cyclase